MVSRTDHSSRADLRFAAHACDTAVRPVDTIDPMAMTLRLDDVEDAALEMLAREQGISKQQAAKRAILDAARRRARAARITDVVARVQERDAELLRRLAQ